MNNCDCSQGRPLSFKTFLIWVLISIYQGKQEMRLFYHMVQCMNFATSFTQQSSCAVN